MDIREIIDALNEQEFKVVSRRDALLESYCVGEELPESFTSWEEVDNVLANLQNKIDDFDSIINKLYKWL